MSIVSAVEKRVLVVEDNATLALGLKANLEYEGFSAVIAETGEEALVLSDLYRPHVIILDIMLPTINGFEVLESLRSHASAARVLVLSARVDEIDRVRAFRSGAHDYVCKPFSLLELMERVKKECEIALAFDSVPGAMPRRT